MFLPSLELRPDRPVAGKWLPVPGSARRNLCHSKGNHHVLVHPGGSLTRAVSARPRACDRLVGASSETGCGGDETRPHPIAKKREVEAPASAHLRMCDSRPGAEQANGMKIDQLQLVIVRFMRATQLDHLDKPGDDEHVAAVTGQTLSAACLLASPFAKMRGRLSSLFFGAGVWRSCATRGNRMSDRSKLLKLALIVFGVVFCLIYPLSM